MIALAQSSALPDGDEHDRLLAARLGAPFVVWDDPAVDWSAYDRVAIRGIHDYTRRLPEFLAWTRRVGGERLVNGLPLITWNTDKRYLGELASAGLPVVPTAFLEPGAPLPEQRGEYVVKPSVSAGSWDTGRFGPGDEAAAGELLARIHASGRTAMLQGYVPSVDERGETALVFFGGAFSHALHKHALLGRDGSATNTFDDPSTIAVREPTEAELATAARVLNWIAGRFGAAPDYARVDLVEDEHGAPMLMELEVIEPCLYFALAPESVERFATVLEG